MKEQSLSILKWQFELTCELAEYHLPRITDDMCFWKPASHCWTVNKDTNGIWIPDFADPEPNPLPSVSIAWLTWHIQWSWSNTIAAVTGNPKLTFDKVFWPGNSVGVRDQFKQMQSEWTKILNSQDEHSLLRSIIHHRAQPTPLWQTFAWLNVELMKNVSEIGLLSILYQNEKT